MANHLHRSDLPDGLDLGNLVAVDCETMGLNPLRDRLCLVQISAGEGDCHLVQFPADTAIPYDSPRLKALLTDPDVTTLFHFARFDLAAIHRYLGVACGPVYCTKIASRLARTFTDRHSLRDLCRELLGIEISKQQQTSDWGAESLTDEQLKYAAADVQHLHALKQKLDEILEREGRAHLAEACCRFLPVRAELDLSGWASDDIFAH